MKTTTPDLVERARDLERGGEVRPRRAAAEDSLLAAELARQLERLAVGDVDDLVHVPDVDVGGDDLLPDALDEIGRRLVRPPRLLVGLEDRAVRVCADDADVRVLLLEEAPRPRDGAARAETGDEVRDVPLGLLPKLRAGRAVVRLRVVRVASTGRGRSCSASRARCGARSRRSGRACPAWPSPGRRPRPRRAPSGSAPSRPKPSRS